MVTVTGKQWAVRGLLVAAAPLALISAGPATAQGVSPAETALRAEVRDSRSSDNLQAYLGSYPQGVSAALARRRLVDFGVNIPAPVALTVGAAPAGHRVRPPRPASVK